MVFYVCGGTTYRGCRSRVVPESCLGVGCAHLCDGEFEVACRGEAEEESDKGRDEDGSGDAQGGRVAAGAHGGEEYDGASSADGE